MQLKRHLYNFLVLVLGTLSPPSSACNAVGCFDCRPNGICRSGCRDGYTDSTCYTCEQGYYPYYNQNNYYCNICPKNCIACTSYDNCSSCNDGYQGQWCNTLCPNGCSENKCVKNTGKCSNGCKVNHYGEYCNPCSPGCYSNQCNWNGVCTNNCINGYVGDKCDSCQTGWFKSNGICKQCRDTCESCTSYDTCSSCVSGYHGTDCTLLCSEGCSNNICNKFSGQCTSGCRAGYYGSMCTVCSKGCESTCDSSNGYCSCKPGHSGNQCKFCLNGWYMANNECYQCPNNCATCQLSTQCNSCDSGFYGNACENSCPHGCLDGCFKDTGVCFSCRDGYSGDKCCVQSLNCLACSSDTSCSQCKLGFYGVNCGQTCPANCKGGCIKDSGQCTSCKDSFSGSMCNETCPIKCVTCSIKGQCLTCKEGFYGQSCNNACPENCLSCRDNENCNTCIAGYYGVKCESKCPDSCETCSSSSYCDKCKKGFSSTDGCKDSCSESCSSCSILSKYDCTECVRGKYSTYSCYANCPTFCNHGFCNIFTGECTYGCVDGYIGSNCCPENCSSCQEKTGRCYENYCNYGYKGQNCNCKTEGCNDSTCTVCKNNVWYLNGNICCRCRSTCKNRVCHNDMTCIEGCIDGFYGDLCDKRCMDKDINCLLCDADKCTKCISGFFPDQLGQCVQCSVNCLNGNCSSSDGTCLEGCREQYWGPNCSNNCPNSCQVFTGSSSCDSNTGECSFGCSSNKHGKACDKNCSNTCLEDECDWKTGACTKGCVIDHYGQLCENACSTSCVPRPDESKCNYTSGECTVGCKKGYYGDLCQHTCGNNCANQTCSRSDGECIFGCADGFEGSFCIQAMQQSSPPDNTTTIAGASAGAALILIIILVVVVCLVVRRRKKNSKGDGNFDDVKKGHQNPVFNGNGPVYSNSADSVDLNIDGPENKPAEVTKVANPTYQNHALHTSLHLPSVSESDVDVPEVAETPLQTSIAPSGDTYYNAGAITRTRVTVDNLAEYVSGKSKEELVDEFKKLPKDLYKPYADSQKSANVKRNRYKGIYPYDFNRVKLEVPKGKSDFINASYIDGFRKDKEYIAALGPTDGTTDKFATTWRMLWQQNVEKIVMLTNLTENTKMKCHQYWPDPNTSLTYDDVNVRCLSEEIYAEFTVRTFSVTKASEKRVLTQFHFTAWPDRGVPSDVTGLLEFRNKVQSIKSKFDGPTVVHCSAGVGRTGTYIALDYLTKEGEATKSVDVFECATNLRSQRVYMVQAEEQYVYIHDAIVHSLTFDSKPVPSDHFQDYMKALDNTALQQKFQMLMSYRERPQDDEVEAVKRNKTFTDKNHPTADIPGDRYRVKLHLSGVLGSSDYINAVFIDTYREKYRHVVTQTPLKSTVEDFLILLFQENIACVVDMEPDQSQKDNGPYLPEDNQTTSHGDFTISSKVITSNNNFVERELTLKWNKNTGEEKRTCTHYQYKAWDSKTTTPTSAADFVSFVRSVDSKAKEQHSDGKITIHCITGSERSCLFSIVSNLIQKMETEQQVSVVNVVRQIRSRRSTAIPNKEQFLFCHQCISVYLESFNTYSNFL